MKIALVGNPNSGKTTLFNELTGSQQYVGNWPGVTVEKKEGKLKKNKDIQIVDLPGIYSLSPYTLEEVITRDYLIDESPDVIINIIDASNLERNLYLSTQILELGLPTVVALNMMDIVDKYGDKIDTKKLSQEIGVEIVEISAINGRGIKELVSEAIKTTKREKNLSHKDKFEELVKESIDGIIQIIEDEVEDKENLYWYGVKLFEKDKKTLKRLKLDKNTLDSIEKIVENCEKKYDDDRESIITTGRYAYIEKIVSKSYKRNKREISISDKIDNIVTNKWLALPIFFSILWFIYYVLKLRT